VARASPTPVCGSRAPRRRDAGAGSSTEVCGIRLTPVRHAQMPFGFLPRIMARHERHAEHVAELFQLRPPAVCCGGVDARDDGRFA
jgi:hypothetical protein